MNTISLSYSTLPFADVLMDNRKMLWLKAGILILNNNPKIEASYVMELVTSLSACLRKVRTDCDTENVILAAI